MEVDGASDFAVDAEGDFVVAWVETTTDETQSLIEADIMARRYHADGTPDGDAFLVNTITDNFQMQPSVAMNAAGEFVIIWSNQVGSNYAQVELHARRFDAEGVAQGNEFRVDSTDSYSIFGTLNVEMYNDGGFVVAWDRYNFTNHSDVFRRRYDADGDPLEGEVLVQAGNIFAARPGLTPTSDGGFIMAWADDVTLMGRRFNAAGEVVGSWIDIGNGEMPSIGADATGNFVVTWSQYESNWTIQHVWARRFTAEGVPLSDPFLVSTEPARWEMTPSVEVSPDGNFVISYTVANQDQIHRDVVAREFNSAGVPVGEQFFVHPAVEGDQWAAYGHTAMTPSGDFLISWFDDTEARHVFVQRFQLNLVPTDITLSPGSVQENLAIGATVGTLSGVDADGDDSFTYRLVSGDGDDNNAAFQIVGNELQTNAVFDFESKTSYTVRVRATDLTGASVEKALTIQITNVVEPQVVTLTNSSVEENLPKDTVVGALGLTDAADGSIRYRLVSGEGASGNSRFKISGSQLLTKSSFDAERQSSYSVRVQATDANGNITVQVFTIEIADVNEAPVDLKLSSTTVRTGRPAGTSVGQFTGSDVDAGGTLTYTLVNGRGDSDNSRFAIVGDALLTATEFTSRANYSIRVRVTDQEGASYERVFRIRVARSRETPIGNPLSAWLGNLWKTSSPWWKQHA